MKLMSPLIMECAVSNIRLRADCASASLVTYSDIAIDKKREKVADDFSTENYHCATRLPSDAAVGNWAPSAC